MGYGFHEDGLKAGLNAARQLLADAGARRERPAPAGTRVIELEAVAA
jgi:predicted NAD/FAD-binding protein